METKETKPKGPKKVTWEIKDRTYVLKGSRSPLTYKIRSRGILFYDEATGTNRELRYATNQNSVFVDEQDGNVRLGHIMFNDGTLYVARTNSPLQQLLSLYHPDAGEKWYEVDELKDAEDELDIIEEQMKAGNLVQTLEVEHLEAIMRTELGGIVAEMNSKELKRDAYRFAQKNPKLFMELANDEDIKLRNLANLAVERGILDLTDDGTTFILKSTKKKVMTVPFDTNPYAALAQYFKTDDGVGLMKSLTKKLS